MEIIDIGQIPIAAPKKPVIAGFVQALATLPEGKCIMHVADNSGEARSLQSNMGYYRDRRHRKGALLFPDLKLAVRGNVIFLWKELKGDEK